MQLTLFILKRIGYGIVTLFLLSIIVFASAQILPGDPARAILGPLAAPSAQRSRFSSHARCHQP